MIKEIKSEDKNQLTHIKNELWKFLDYNKAGNTGVGTEEYYLVLYLLLLQREGVLSQPNINNLQQLRKEINNISEKFDGDKEVFYKQLQDDFATIINRIYISVLSDIILLLKSFDQNVLKDNFIEIFDDFLFKYAKSRGKYSDGHLLPGELSKFICGMVDLPENANIYNPFAGFVSFCVGLDKDYPIDSQELTHTTHTIGLMRLIAYDRFLNTVFTQDDSISSWNFNKEKYDLIISSPPFGMRLSNPISGKFGTIKSAEHFYIEKGIEDLKSNGRLIAIISKGFLSAGSTAETNLRHYLIDEDLLEMIIGFPGGILMNTSIPFAIIVINRNKKEKGVVRFIDANNFIDNISLREKKINDSALLSFINSPGESKSCRLIGKEEIVKNDFNFDVNRYLFNLSEEIKDNTITLGDVAKICLRENHIQIAESGRFIRIRDLKKDTVNCILKPDEIEKIAIPKYAYQIQDAGLLLALRFNKLKPTIINWNTEPVFISNDIAALQVDEGKIDILYLISELNSEFVQKQVDAYSSGATISSISKKDILNLRIRLLSSENQKDEVHNRFYEFYNKTYNKLEELKNVYSLKGGTFNELVSLKHSLGRPLLNIGSGIRIIEASLAKSGNTEFYKSLRITLDAIKQNLHLANNILEHNETELNLNAYKLEEIELISFLKNYIQVHNNYSFETKLLIADDFTSEFYNTVLIIANKDLLTVMLNNVLDNAERHAFKGQKNESNKVFIMLDLEMEDVVPKASLSVKNNGLPFPDNFDKEKLVRKNLMAGETANTGIGGYDINRIAIFMGMQFDLKLSRDFIPVLQFPTSYEFSIPIINTKDVNDEDYNVLWVDDEFEKLGLFLEEARIHDIILVGFKSYEEAFENLESKIFEYDAIILDAMFFKTKTQVQGSEDLKGLAAAKDKIAEFRKQRNIPFFILSGQTRLENNNTFSDTYGEHYRKQNPDDITQLFADIKKASDKQAITQVRHQYHGVFEVCTDKYIGKELTRPLLEALLLVEKEIGTLSTEDLFNPIRKIIEKLFTAFNKLGLLPDKIFKGKGWINQSSVFLTGKHPEYKMKSEILAPVIAYNLKSILQVIQDASHTEGELRLKVDQHVRQSGTPYLYKSVVFQFLDILIWFKKYADENPDAKKNKLAWELINAPVLEGEWIKGEITRIADNGYGTFQPCNGGKSLSVIPAMVKEFSLHSPQMVEVITKPDKTGTKILIENIRVL